MRLLPARTLSTGSRAKSPRLSAYFVPVSWRSTSSRLRSTGSVAASHASVGKGADTSHHHNSQNSTSLIMPDQSYSDTQPQLAECERQIGYSFTNQPLLRRCLTHSSSADDGLESNERLEFLGDAILGMTICEILFEAFPEQREGQLTQMKSAIVSRQTCAKVAQRLKLKDLILVGRGLQSMPDSILAAAVESLIAGIYFDGGFTAAKAFITSAFNEELSQCGPQSSDNHKSALQEFTQRELATTPEYIVVNEKGPDHAREFCISARVGDQLFESAWGRSKKEAEQDAAQIALQCLVKMQQDTANRIDD
jgi:ribonuclease III